MAFFEELGECFQTDILQTIYKNNKDELIEHDPSYYTEDTIWGKVDYWINTHNFDLTNQGWREAAEEAEI